MILQSIQLISGISILNLQYNIIYHCINNPEQFNNSKVVIPLQLNKRTIVGHEKSIV